MAKAAAVSFLLFFFFLWCCKRQPERQPKKIIDGFCDVNVKHCTFLDVTFLLICMANGLRIR